MEDDDLSQYQREALGVLLLAIITFTLAYGWNELITGLLKKYARSKDDYLLWLFIYIVALTIFGIIVVLYVFPYFGVHKKIIKDKLEIM